MSVRNVCIECWTVRCGGGLRAHGEDGVGSKRGADRVVLRAGIAIVEHLGSAHDKAQLEALKAAAVTRLAQGQQTCTP